MIPVLIALFIFLLLFGLPIFAALALSVAGAVWSVGPLDPVIMPMRMFSGMNNFSLMAIPFFILASELMRIGGLSQRLINFAEALIGWVPGGLAAAAVLSCLFFGSISGSSPATVIAIGSIMFPALVEAGYSKRFSIGLLTTAGTLGPIVPPSIALIIYGAVTGTSVGNLFVAGVLPAILIGGLLILVCIVFALREKYPRSAFPTLEKVSSSFKQAAWGLGLPILMLGGIYSGAFTPTESAAVACVYGLFVGMVVYRQIGWSELLEILKSSGTISAALLLITAGAAAFSWLLAFTGTPVQLSQNVLSLTDSPVWVVMLFNVVMLITGFFLDSASAIIVLSPLLQPIALKVGIDPVHFGVITLVNFSIGMLTPPVGLNLFVAMTVSKMSLQEVFKACLPFILVMLLALVAITYIPVISMGLPNLIVN
ncbi:TRAP transporter large permease [Cohaesibacter celericrescens]|uniref:TRAP transporter large permease protein n=1 Tax=Cohaesibacter celericrescens TaxID=2067669 RepID=A0A2N5XQ79_9HYPH|nr:TRAP transporter large permease [Cohaesibacter celericrescens]PLW76590.1 TRAP transporter large permease [Cohaesibacter celericrescens]